MKIPAKRKTMPSPRRNCRSLSAKRGFELEEDVGTDGVDFFFLAMRVWGNRAKVTINTISSMKCPGLSPNLAGPRRLDAEFLAKPFRGIPRLFEGRSKSPRRGV